MTIKKVDQKNTKASGDLYVDDDSNELYVAYGKKRDEASLTKISGISSYNTGWINRSDWTNVKMGTDTAKNADSNVTHSLAAALPSLIVNLFVSATGADSDCFLIGQFESNGATTTGYTLISVDTNNFTFQTGTSGLYYINSGGSATLLDAEDWYYKIIVYKAA